MGRFDVFVGIFCAVLACSVCDARPKAVIGYGWEFLAATTEDVHRNRAKFAESGVDGIIMKIDGCDADGKWFSSHRLPEAKRMWSDADFKATRVKLSEITASKGLGNSLGLILLTPTKRIDWILSSITATLSSLPEAVNVLITYPSPLVNIFF